MGLILLGGLLWATQRPAPALLPADAGITPPPAGNLATMAAGVAPLQTQGAAQGAAQGTALVRAAQTRLAAPPAALGDLPAPPPGGPFLVPLIVSVSAFDNSTLGGSVDVEYEGGLRYSWLTWNGDAQPAALAAGLTAPGTRQNYRSPAPNSSTLEVGAWVRGRPPTDSPAVRQALEALAAYRVTLPLFAQQRHQVGEQQYQLAGCVYAQIVGETPAPFHVLTLLYWGSAPCAAHP